MLFSLFKPKPLISVVLTKVDNDGCSRYSQYESRLDSIQTNLMKLKKHSKKVYECNNLSSPEERMECLAKIKKGKCKKEEAVSECDSESLDIKDFSCGDLSTSAGESEDETECKEEDDDMCKKEEESADDDICANVDTADDNSIQVMKLDNQGSDFYVVSQLDDDQNVNREQLCHSANNELVVPVITTTSPSCQSNKLHDMSGGLVSEKVFSASTTLQPELDSKCDSKSSHGNKDVPSLDSLSKQEATSTGPKEEDDKKGDNVCCALAQIKKGKVKNIEEGANKCETESVEIKAISCEDQMSMSTKASEDEKECTENDLCKEEESTNDNNSKCPDEDQSEDKCTQVMMSLDIKGSNWYLVSRLDINEDFNREQAYANNELLIPVITTKPPSCQSHKLQDTSEDLSSKHTMSSTSTIQSSSCVDKVNTRSVISAGRAKSGSACSSLRTEPESKYNSESSRGSSLSKIKQGSASNNDRSLPGTIDKVKARRRSIAYGEQIRSGSRISSRQNELNSKCDSKSSQYSSHTKIKEVLSNKNVPSLDSLQFRHKSSERETVISAARTSDISESKATFQTQEAENSLCSNDLKVVSASANIVSNKANINNGTSGMSIQKVVPLTAAHLRQEILEPDLTSPCCSVNPSENLTSQSRSSPHVTLSSSSNSKRRSQVQFLHQCPSRSKEDGSNVGPAQLVLVIDSPPAEKGSGTDCSPIESKTSSTCSNPMKQISSYNIISKTISNGSQQNKQSMAGQTKNGNKELWSSTGIEFCTSAGKVNESETQRSSSGIENAGSQEKQVFSNEQIIMFLNTSLESQNPNDEYLMLHCSKCKELCLARIVERKVKEESNIWSGKSK